MIWGLHLEKGKNTASLPYKLHERQGYYEIVKEIHQQKERLHNETVTNLTRSC